MNTLQWKLNEFTSPKGGSALSLSCVSPRFRPPSRSGSWSLLQRPLRSLCPFPTIPCVPAQTSVRRNEAASGGAFLETDSLTRRVPHLPGPTPASHLEESSSLLGLPQVSESKFNQRGVKVQKQREAVKEDKNNNSLVIWHLMRRADSLEKTLMLRGIGGRRRRGREEEMAGWRHWIHGHGFGWTPGVGDGQGGLECCDSWGHKEPDTTERLNWPELRPKTKSRIFGSSSRAIDNILSHILGLFCRH